MMTEYTDKVTEGVAKAVDDTAKKVLEATKAAAPVKTGRYKKGWTITKRGDYKDPKRIIWNKDRYSLVHLLEFGHAKVNGGRVSGKPHVRPAYEAHGAQLPEHIARIIENGGG